MTSSEQQLDELRRENEDLKAQVSQYRTMFDTVVQGNPEAMVVADAEGNLTFNAAAEKLFGSSAVADGAPDWAEAHELFRADGTPYSGEDLPLARALAGHTVERELMVYHPASEAESDLWLSVDAYPLPVGGAVAVIRDVSENRRLSADLAARAQQVEERDQRNEQLIEQLRVAVEELSTPVLQLWDDVLALPVVGLVDTRRGAEMAERLLEAVTRTRSKYVIIDLTGVELVDTSTAERFIKLARSVDLLGAECVITGIQAPVAQTLIELGVELEGLQAHRDLKQALEVCMERLGSRDERTTRVAGAT